MRKLNIHFKQKTYSAQHVLYFCIDTELSRLVRIRQNTAIYGYVPRTAEVLCTRHKGNQLFPGKIAWLDICK